jgi:hypothetical protein
MQFSVPTRGENKYMSEKKEKQLKEQRNEKREQKTYEG